jgi:hypothetical protein
MATRISISTLLKTPDPVEEPPLLAEVTLPRNLRYFDVPLLLEKAIPPGFRRLEKSMHPDQILPEMDILLASRHPETVVLRGCHVVEEQTPLGSHLRETCMSLEDPLPKSGIGLRTVTLLAHRILSHLAACKYR